MLLADVSVKEDSFSYAVAVTDVVKNEEINKLMHVKKPPINVVNLIPMRSLNIPANIDKKNVVPRVREPISAEKAECSR